MQPYQTHSKVGKKKSLGKGAKGTGSGKMLPRVMPKKVGQAKLKKN